MQLAATSVYTTPIRSCRGQQEEFDGSVRCCRRRLAPMSCWSGRKAVMSLAAPLHVPMGHPWWPGATGDSARFDHGRNHAGSPTRRQACFVVPIHIDVSCFGISGTHRLAGPDTGLPDGRWSAKCSGLRPPCHSSNAPRAAPPRNSPCPLGPTWPPAHRHGVCRPTPGPEEPVPGPDSETGTAAGPDNEQDELRWRKAASRAVSQWHALVARGHLVQRTPSIGPKAVPGAMKKAP